VVPIGGGSVMTPEKTADAIALLRPKIAVPIHYTDKKHYVKFRDVAHPYTNVIALHAPSARGEAVTAHLKGISITQIVDVLYFYG